MLTRRSLAPARLRRCAAQSATRDTRHAAQSARETV